MAKKRATNSHKTKQLTRAERRFNKIAEEQFGTHSKSKLGKRRTEYVREYIKLENRAKTWKKKHGIEFKDFPSPPRRVTQSDIESIKNITYKRVSKDSRYTQPQREYSPQTEDDYLNQWEQDIVDNSWNEPDWDESWGKHTNIGEDRDAEMREFIDEKINEIISTSSTAASPETYHERQGILSDLLKQAENLMGTEDFYDFLQDPDVCDNLNEYATAYLEDSDGKRGEQDAENHLNQFITTLNHGKPLTGEQLYQLEAYGRLTFSELY